MNLALVGYGKMGKAIEKIAVNKGHKIVLTSNSYSELKKNLPSEPGVDVAIEFSAPEAAFQNIKFCLQNGIPVISGTTGWLAQLPDVKEFTTLNDGTFFYASNFSLGVNLFFQLNKRLAELLANTSYVASIDETHHVHKLDKPSGTAITLAEEIINKNTNLTGWLSNQPTDGKDLVINSLREDKVPGTHIVSYKGENDEITIKHEAFNREGFAQGVIAVAEWIINKKGILTMDDFLDG